MLVHGSKWDWRFMRLAQTVAAWSKDPSTQVGAVLVDPTTKASDHGYNGFPVGISDDSRLHDRETKYRIIIHAELNVLLRAGPSARGKTMYVWPFQPCAHCAAVMVQCGVARMVSLEPDGERAARWAKDFALSEEILREGGVAINFLNPGDEEAWKSAANSN